MGLGYVKNNNTFSHYKTYISLNLQLSDSTILLYTTFNKCVFVEIYTAVFESPIFVQAYTTRLIEAVLIIFRKYICYVDRLAKYYFRDGLPVQDEQA